MKASEALRKGIGMVKGQTRNGLFYDEQTECACAVGCIAIGNGVEMKHETIHECLILTDYYPTFRAYRERYGEPISADNDIYGFTLSEIAQRLEDIGE